MYMITITPEDPCGPSDWLGASGTSMLAAIANIFDALQKETEVDDFVGLEDILSCLADVTKQMENNFGMGSFESKHHDMDPTYSFTVKCEWIPSNGK